jgi:hypothetical protein
MLLQAKVAQQIELEDMTYSGDATSDALQIEEVLNRAHQIHRGHGGLFGYDLEDWLEAERELFERSRPGHFQIEEMEFSEPHSRDQQMNCQKCFGLND